jgi:Bacterial regulatory protein, Fis family
MADGKRITARDLELTDTLSTLPPQTLKEARETVEREMVKEALRRHMGKITAAALELGVSRPTLYELMEKLGMSGNRHELTDDPLGALDCRIFLRSERVEIPACKSRVRNGFAANAAQDSGWLRRNCLQTSAAPLQRRRGLKRARKSLILYGWDT